MRCARDRALNKLQLCRETRDMIELTPTPELDLACRTLILWITEYGQCCRIGYIINSQVRNVDELRQRLQCAVYSTAVSQASFHQ